MKKVKTALLIMDMQSSILGMMQEAAGMITNINQLIAHARHLEMPVIFVVVGFRPGTPEISSNNKGFSAAAAHYEWTDDFSAEWMVIHPGVSRQKTDIIVTKRRVSAFAGSDLEVVLRASGIEHLVLTGIATSGVVLSTLREAADKDYKLTVIADCCADTDDEVNNILMNKIFPRQAEVVSLSAWMQ